MYILSLWQTVCQDNMDIEAAWSILVKLFTLLHLLTLFLLWPYLCARHYHLFISLFIPFSLHVIFLTFRIFRFNGGKTVPIFPARTSLTLLEIKAIFP